MVDTPTRILIAGAGIAGLETALALRALAGDRAEIELLEPRTDLMVAAESTAHPFGRRPRRLPLAPLAERAGARLIRGRLAEVLPGERIAVTEGGAALGYDRLVIAIGARAEPFLRGAVTFAGPDDAPAMRRMVSRLVQGARRGMHTRVAFVVPPGAAWPLAAYELALQTDRLLRRRGVRDRASLTLVTSEDAPLAIFGTRASEAVAGDLAGAGIATRAGAIVREWSWGRLELGPSGRVLVDRVVAVPALRGPAIPGLPSDALGFVRAGSDGRVAGVPAVFVVGDAGPFPVKQGGIACQQADAVASLMALELGAHPKEIPFDPVLRGWLWDGDHGRYMRANLPGGRDESAGVTTRRRPLWSPGGKVACRFLSAVLDDGPLAGAPRDRAIVAETPSR
jgi:sulfide:quinone oxidoreductase